METIFHPAQYNERILEAITGYAVGSTRVLDPMAGVGNIFKIANNKHNWIFEEICAVELEPEWASFDQRIFVGSALQLPWSDNYFDCIAVSPPYGNRMADKLSVGKWARTRISYAVGINRELSSNNIGAMQWGDKYREFCKQAWIEARRVLAVSGKFILNIKDHIRNKAVQDVTLWHRETLAELGFTEIDETKIMSTGVRYGKNHNARVDYESVILFQLKYKP